MRRFVRFFFSVTAMAATVASAAAAQAGVTISGRVTNEAGAPLPGVNVFLQGLNIGTQTGDNGRYTFNVSAARATGQAATLTARVIGYAAKSASVTLTPGANITQDFLLAINPLRLGEVVVTGAGTSTTRERLTATINSVDSSLIRRSSNPQNIVSALTAKAPNVEVRTQSGDPGASASIKIRGTSSFSGSGQPLFIVDGQPIDNSTEATSPDGVGNAALSGTVATNRASDINPNDIESVDILKGAGAAAIYGARAANGVVLITTKRGRSGPTRYTFSSTETFDHVRPNIKLQTKYGQGDNRALPAGCGVASASCDVSSFGPAIAAGTPVYNHVNEIFDTGLTADNNLQISGGNDRTTFFMSGGLTNQDGAVIGPNNKYNRFNVRLKGSQFTTATLNLEGNLSYVDTRGSYVQKGSNTSGLLLGALRTPPTFNNSYYIDSISGTQRSYRFPHPTAASGTIGRGYDNPFWTAYVPVARSELGRSISNVTGTWSPLDWFELKETLGGDYYSDWRLQAWPLTASGNPLGRVVRNDNNNLEIDHNLIATLKHTFTSAVNGNLTLGQNLNSRRSREVYILGDRLNAPLPYSLQNTIGYTPIESRALAHIEAYFAQGELSMYDQLYLKALIRNDGYSTFGPSNRRASYPAVGLAWNFTNAMGNTEQKGLLSYGKLRVNYGETGKEPPIYAAVNAYTNTFTFSSGFNDLINTNQSGQGGLTSSSRLGNPGLKPERNRETELGFDLGLLDQKADLSATYYDKHSTDVILPVTVNTAQTGANTAYKNGAAITNKGLELSFNVRPYTSQNVAWDFGVQFGRNHGNVTSLLGSTIVSSNGNVEGFNGAAGSDAVGFAPGVLVGNDFVRCGRGLKTVVPGAGATAINVDSMCTANKAPNGALVLGLSTNSTGQPIAQPIRDGTNRVIADPSPKYTMSYNTSVKLYNNLRLSALVDVRKGGTVWNGTRAALLRFGTSTESLVRDKTDAKFGVNYDTKVYPNTTGPGASSSALSFNNATDWYNWFVGNGASGGPQAQFMEDGGYVKLRELSLTYTLPARFLRGTTFSSADFRIAGRNLRTWTKYSGFDPEANLAGAQSLTQGIDFFNNPQTRSLVLSVSLNR